MTPRQQIQADAMDFWINELHPLNWPYVLADNDLESLKQTRDSLLKMSRYLDEIINISQVPSP